MTPESETRADFDKTLEALNKAQDPDAILGLSIALADLAGRWHREVNK